MIEILALALGAPLLAAPPRPVQDPPLPEHPRELHRPPTRPFVPPQPERRELEGGGRLLVIENPELPLVDGQLVFRGGSLLEGPDQAGLVELAAEVLRSGGSTETTGTELDDWLDSHAASIGVTSDLDTFRITFSCLSEDLASVLGLIGELLASPAYPESEVEKAERRLQARIAREEEDDGALADRTVRRVVYGADSPLARRPLERTVSALRAGDLRRFHTENLGTKRLLAGAVGAVAADDLVTLLGGVLAGLPSGDELPAPPGEAFLQPARRQIHLYDRPGRQQSEIRIAAPGTRRSHRDACALSLWSRAIGYGGMSNRLMVRLRTERGLAYAAGLYFQPEWERAGMLYGFCRTRNESVGLVATLILDLLREGLEPLPEEELLNARSRLLNAEVFEVDLPEKVLARELELELHGYPPDFWEQHSSRLRALSSGDVAEATARHLDIERLVVVVVGPAMELEGPLSELGEVIRIDPVPAGLALVDAVLDGVGGREAWRGRRFLESELQLVRSGGPAVALHVWLDLSGPRMRVEQTLGATRTLLVVNEKGAWMRAGDSVLELPREQHEALVAAANRDVFRLLAQLARAEECPLERRDAIRLELVGGEAAGTWLELDDAGHLARVGYERGGEEVVLRYTGWRDFDGVFAPSGIEKLPDVWTRKMESVRNVEEIDEALFERP